MGAESPESGIEELLRLSRQTSQVEQKLTHQVREDTKKKQVVEGLKEIKLAVALEQLKSIASRTVVAEVDSLRRKKGHGDLRRLISDMVSDLEKDANHLSRTAPHMSAMVRNIRTLAILIELLFSLE